ncbi:response regulator transcription factor [Halobaculum halobium]|uniref:Response regulator transcription factor n=1 Tax=Halobaculum halobium TaxID=3032281 RepID=A0ABD5TA07_9EURY|nr:HalX domain-containing protein [Halobaculum sp. SYNS20]
MSEETDAGESEDAAGEPAVLVVEDEPDLADLYAAWLGGDYDVRTAYGGQKALDELDDDVDVILLDRRMPGLSGDEVLDEVRARGIDARVAMVTAVEPDFDIIEMGFDDYLVKPVTRESLLETVEGLYTRSTYDSRVQELFAVSSKMAVLEAEKGRAALDESAEYESLEQRAHELRTELDEDVADFADGDFERAFRDLDADGDADDDLFDDADFEDF